MQKSNYVVVAVLVGILLIVLLITFLVRFFAPLDPSDIDTLFGDVSAEVFLDERGDPVSFASYEGGVRVINSYASWSPFSTEELQDLNLVAGEYQDRGVSVLAVNRDEPPARIAAFLNTLPPLPHLVFVRDTEDMLYPQSAGYTMPETLFYSAEGELVFHKRGALTLEEMRAQIEAALAVGE